VVIAVELCVGLSLMTDWLLPWSALAGLTLLILFTAIIIAAIIRGKSGAKCGCIVFARSGRLGWHLCLRNAALMCLLLPSLAWKRSETASRVSLLY